MSRSDFSLNDIHLALDGELPADDRADFEHWLDAHPDMKALSTRFERDRATLAAALAPILEETVPARLEKRVSGEIRPRRSWGQYMRYAAAAAILLVVGGVAGYGLGVTNPSEPKLEDQIVSDAIAAHTMYAAEKLHVVEVGADQKDHLLGWLSQRVGTTLVLADFSPEGFALVGGRLLPLAERPSAQFIYQDQSGNRVSLYVTADEQGEETGFRRYAEDGALAIYWVDKGYCYAVTGAVSEDKLAAIANAAYRQLLDRTPA
jgi:anti-sigma factor RsiW